MERQIEAVERRSVKLLRPDIQSSELQARFDAERQKLAVMQHPNIATMLP